MSTESEIKPKADPTTEPPSVLAHNPAAHVPPKPTTFFPLLWSSIFTPGTTPTLLIATHTSFVALLLVIITMYVATRSLHFVALGTVAIALWASITWFVAELEKAGLVEEKAGRIRKERQRRRLQGEEKDEGSDSEEEGKKDI